MSNQDDSKKIDLTELIDMCNNHPSNVSLSNRAVQDGNKDFNLPTESEIKIFIGDGNLEDAVFKGCDESRELIGVFITPYTFRTGTKFGYLAYHRKKNDNTKIHIKSFHKDNLNPKNALSSLADFFPKSLNGEENE